MIRHVRSLSGGRALVGGGLALLAILASPALLARQQDPLPSPPRTLRFVVQVSPDDLTIDQVPVPNEQIAISRVSLRPGASPVGYSQVPGQPRLPFVTRSVALPPGAQLLSIQAVALKSAPVAGQAALVSWAQPPRASQNSGPKPPVYSDGHDPFFPAHESVPLDQAVLKAAAWPASLVEMGNVADALHYQLTTLRMSPVQWLPAKAQLVLHTEILVEVTWRGGAAPQLVGGYAEAMQLANLRTRIVNPEDVPFVPVPDTPLTGDVWYLIVTDDFQWNSDITIGAPIPGGLVREFQRLADWKTRKGLKTGVVRISDIVRGVYGDFVTGARDLQEVLRNFLKFANREWNTYWVLLGGDVEVVPVRQVIGISGNDGFDYWLEPDPDSEQPAAGKSRWHAATATMRIHLAEPVAATTAIVDYQSGRAYRQVLSPSAGNPGWAFVTSNTYDIETGGSATTEFMVLRGPVDEVSRMFPIATLKANSVPTDFYYTSLSSALYGRPGLHDWDANGNELYGQHNQVAAYDGVNFFANVALGRAPVKSDQDARVFVDKVIAYERYPDPLRSTSFGRKVLFGASDWDGSEPGVTDPVFFGSCEDLTPSQYCSVPHRLPWSTVRMRFATVRSMDADWRLLYLPSSAITTVIPYDPAARDAVPRRNGWYYCADSTCASPSVFTVYGSGGDVVIPLPTEWVQVEFASPRPGSSTGIGMFWFEANGADQALREQEHIRWQLSLLAPGLTARTRLYDDVTDAPPDPAVPARRLTDVAIDDYISGGANVVSLTGHGLPDGCCGLWSSLVPQYDNLLLGGVIYTDSCLTNAFDENQAISEQLLTSDLGGVAAYVGSTRVAWIGYGANYEQLFWSGLPFTRHVGDLLNARVVYAHDASDFWSIFSLNLLGDPEMPLWLGVPHELVVVHPAGGVDGSLFAVAVHAPDGTPLPGSRVTLVYADGAMASGLTDADGQQRFRARGAAGNVMHITVTRTDYRPYEGEIRIEAPSHFERPLFAGTNYISTPLVPVDPAMDAIFASIAKAVAEIATWDRATSRVLTWAPGRQNNTLLRLEAGRGYEVRMRAAAPLVIAGERTDVAVSLLPGRNDVGFTSLNPMPVGDGFASIRGAYVFAYTWDAATRQFLWYFPDAPWLSTLRRLEPGAGYVIWATKPAAWTLPTSPGKQP